MLSLAVFSPEPLFINTVRDLLNEVAIFVIENCDDGCIITFGAAAYYFGRGYRQGESDRLLAFVRRTQPAS